MTHIGEGLNIPLIKVAENDEYREDVIELVLANNRLPDMMRREMAALMGSTRVAERRMAELLDKYGRETVVAVVDEMIERTETAVRAEIAKWPSGTWSVEVETDDDGLNLGVPVHVRCDLTIKDGELFFDFSRTDDQVAGMINAYYQQTLSCTLCTTFLFLGSELAAYHNEGSMKPIHVITRKGSLVDCNKGALVAAGPAINGGMVIEAVMLVLSQALPEAAIAPYGPLDSLTLLGKDPSKDGIYVYTSFCAVAGAGAVTGFDGYQCVCDLGTLGVVGKTDAEEEMARFPWQVDRYQFSTDSHGAGRWRGAPGIDWEVTDRGAKANLTTGTWTGIRGAKRRLPRRPAHASQSRLDRARRRDPAYQAAPPPHTRAGRSTGAAECRRRRRGRPDGARPGRRVGGCEERARLQGDGAVCLRRRYRPEELHHRRGRDRRVEGLGPLLR